MRWIKLVFQSEKFMNNIDKHIGSKILIILATNLMILHQSIVKISYGNNRNQIFIPIPADKMDNHLLS